MILYMNSYLICCHGGLVSRFFFLLMVQQDPTQPIVNTISTIINKLTVVERVMKFKEFACIVTVSYFSKQGDGYALE